MRWFCFLLPPAALHICGFDNRVAVFRIVARRNNKRHTQRKAIIAQANRLLIFNLDDDFFMRPEIGNRIGEDVGALLFDESSLLTFAFAFS